MPKIIVKIDKFGQPVIEAEGFTGFACKKATATLEKALGAGANVSETKRPEMYAAEARNTIFNRGG